MRIVLLPYDDPVADPSTPPFEESVLHLLDNSECQAPSERVHLVLDDAELPASAVSANDVGHEVRALIDSLPSKVLVTITRFGADVRSEAGRDGMQRLPRLGGPIARLRDGLLFALEREVETGASKARIVVLSQRDEDWDSQATRADVLREVRAARAAHADLDIVLLTTDAFAVDEPASESPLGVETRAVMSGRYASERRSDRISPWR